MDPSLAQRLLAKAHLDQETGCWTWNGRSKLPAFCAVGEVIAYRVAYVLWIGPLEEGDWVVRTCSNRRCINPGHLVALRPRRDQGAWPRRGRIKPRALATHCKRGHPFTAENTISNPGYEVVDGVRKKVTYRACRACRDLRAADYTPPSRPSPPPIRSIEDPNDRFLEQIIRRVTRAPVAERLSEIRRALEGEIDWRRLAAHRYQPLPAGESYREYRNRAAGDGSFEEWILSRIFADPRIQKELSRPGVVLLDPLLRAQVNRAGENRTDALPAEVISSPAE